jgi:hypothetical protein
MIQELIEINLKIAQMGVGRAAVRKLHVMQAMLRSILAERPLDALACDRLLCLV